MNKKILVVDDEKEMLESMNKILSRRQDFFITLSSDLEDAISKIGSNKFDLVISDLRLNEKSGMEILQPAFESNKDIKVIMISGYGTVEASVEAVKKGAFDFIEKPFTSQKLFESIDRALESGQSLKPADKYENLIDDTGLILKSDKMREVVRLINKIATTDMNVLVIGESGTGKELVARAIHNLSRSSQNPFVPVNCGALPEHLFESEIFGHEKGAFTGAVKTKPGLIEFANHGTFFFDEIGDMSPTLQVKLLRMLEERKIRRVGGQKEIAINVRIIAATNRNLEQLVKEEKFRDDLYYRLNTFKITIPPLRERKDDIIPLAKAILTDVSSNNNSMVTISPDAENALISYSWPGNVRELQNVLNRASILCNDAIIRRDDLPLPILKREDEIDTRIHNLNYKDAKELVIQEFEIEYLTYFLRKNTGNISKTADECGLDRRSIHRLINKYNIVYKEE